MASPSPVVTYDQLQIQLVETNKQLEMVLGMLSKSNQALIESNKTVTEVNQALAEANETITKVTQYLLNSRRHTNDLQVLESHT
jgi:hypothetical protein